MQRISPPTPKRLAVLFEITPFDVDNIDIPNPPNDLKTAILYLNTNNGYTQFASRKVSSVANRLVVFKADESHFGTTNSCDAPYRLVLNLNYF